jgi:hypothetical protein
VSLTEYLDQLDQLRAKATPGEWSSQENRVYARGYRVATVVLGGEPGAPEADAALIVAAVNALPKLTRPARERDALRQAVLDLAEELDATVLELGRLGDLKRTADRLRAVAIDALGDAA